MADTIFKALAKYFKNSDSYSNNPLNKYETEISSRNEILRTKDKNEFLRLKQQKQQLKYLRGQWGKISNVVTNRALMYEAQRIPAYYDYEMMSYYDIIGRALEIYSEESCVLNEEGKILNIFSESKRVEEELNDLFFNKLNIHTNLPMWTAQTIKNGDSFLHLNLDDEQGVVGCRQLPAIEIERIEGDYLGRYYTGNINTSNETIFRWKADSIVEFRKWQICHFRLLLDESRIPYGVSILEKIRKLYQNIVLAEDALLTQQIIRGIDRLIYYVDVGQIDHDAIEPYVQEIMSKIKRKKHIDPQTGQIDLKHNIMAIDQDYVIPKRGADDTSSIEKLEGKSQMDTSVIDYLMKKLVMSIGIPKSFLNYEEAVGDGKNLSMLDIRFARTVNRIQQAMIQGLNHIAIVHLYLKGLHEELGNFQISLNNASIQTEIMRTELMQQKVSLFRDATDAAGAGIAPMSATRAKSIIFNMTNDEILEDIRQQKFEKAIAAEIENAPAIITNTGVFKDLDAIYGDPLAAANPDGNEENEGDDIGGSGSSGGGSIGGGISGSLDSGEEDLGDEEGLPTDEETGDADTEETGDIGADDNLELGESFNLEKRIDELLKD